MKAFTVLPIALLGALVNAGPLTSDAPAGFNTLNALLTRAADSTTCVPERKAVEACVQNLEDELAQCEATAAKGSPLEDYTQCPAIDKQTITVGSVTYTQYCNQGVPRTETTYKRTDLRYAACLQACTDDTACKAVNYWPKSDQPCVLFGTYAGRPSSRSDQWILIGAIPTGTK